MGEGRNGVRQNAESRSFEEMAIRTLRAKGYRLTLARSEVVYALAQATKPMAPAHVHAAISERGVRADLVSVYRILDTLEQLGVAHKVTAGAGYMPCQLQDGHRTDSVHLVCLDCGIALELPLDTKIGEPIVIAADRKRFLATCTRIEVRGLCQECLSQKNKGETASDPSLEATTRSTA